MTKVLTFKDYTKKIQKMEKKLEFVMEMACARGVDNGLGSPYVKNKTLKELFNNLPPKQP
jgi:hypothetical protein